MTGTSQHTFGADIQQLMHIIIHTFYSNKDVFLRELISNASDALDKVRYASLQDSSLLNGNSDLNIRIQYNKEEKKLVITDSGIGMNKEDILQNIGTIASSGTKRFIQALEEKKDMNLIGQFGVGFYSAFLVADRVVVRTKKAGDTQQYVWESSGESTFSVDEDNDTDTALVRGTSIELYLREEDNTVYGSIQKLKDIVKTHSEFICFPIQLEVEKTREVDVEEEVDSDDDKPVIEEETEDKKEKKTKTETYNEWETLNSLKPIWLRKPEQVEAEEYKSFYSSFSSAGGEFITHSHFSVESQVNVNGLLFTPKSAPADIFTKDAKQHIKLYVKRVFITDQFDNILPDYLKFVQGVIDSEDLPLTVSREMLQQNRTVKSVKNIIVKQSLKMLEALTENEDDYNTFYKEYSKNLKLGVHEDEKNQSKLLELLRYPTSLSEDTMVSFQTYVDNMKEGQPGIYYLTGENIDQVKSSPFLQKLRKKGYEVLYMTDAIDEYVVSKVTEYKDKKLLCVSKQGVDLGDDEEDKKQLDRAQDVYKTLCDKMTEYLKSKISKVAVSDRIVDSPCCLVSANFGMTANMERIMKAQTLGKGNGMMDFMSKNRVLEINPNHSMIQSLAVRLSQGEDIENTTWLLYESASLDSGFMLEQPSQFVSRIYAYLENQITTGIDVSEFQTKLTASNIETIQEEDTTSSEHDSIKEDVASVLQESQDTESATESATPINIEVSEE